MPAVLPSRRPVRRRIATALTAVLTAVTASTALCVPARAAINPNVVPPGNPTIVSVTPGDGSITVEWAPSAVGDPVTDVAVAVLPDHLACKWVAGPTTCTVSGLTNGRDYSVDILASNAGGRSDTVVWPSLVTPFGHPGAPQSVTTVPGDSSALVAWAAPASDGGRPVTSYSVGTLPPGGSCEVTTGPLMCQVGGLTNGVPYVFVVTATNVAGPGPSSAPVAAVTPRTVPGPVTGVGATAGDRRLDVTWTPPADDGGMPITGYTASAVPGGQSCTWTAGPLACTIEGLVNGTEYAVTVEATNVAGAGPRVQSTGTYRPVTVPAAPSVRWSTPRDGAVDVVIAPTPDDGGSEVLRHTVTASTGQQCVVLAVPFRCTVRGLTNGAPVTFRVTATNAVGTSPASAVSAPAVPFTAPSAPTAVVAVARAGRVDVRWAAVVRHGGRALQRYIVEISSDGRTWRPVAASLPATPRAVLRGLPSGRFFGVRVVVVNVGGRSAASAATLVRTA